MGLYGPETIEHAVADDPVARHSHHPSAHSPAAPRSRPGPRESIDRDETQGNTATLNRPTPEPATPP